MTPEEFYKEHMNAPSLPLKRFKFVNLFHKVAEEFNENELPEWVTHKENKWFLDRHVMKLKVGDSIDTDFQRITRVA